MPNQSDLLEWNEENFARVVGDLFREAETDASLHQRLLTEPFEVFSTRIAIPEEYRGGFFAREKGRKALIIYVPSRERTAEALPEGTTDAESQSSYEILCTIGPIW